MNYLVCFRALGRWKEQDPNLQRKMLKKSWWSRPITLTPLISLFKNLTLLFLYNSEKNLWALIKASKQKHRHFYGHSTPYWENMERERWFIRPKQLPFDPYQSIKQFLKEKNRASHSQKKRFCMAVKCLKTTTTRAHHVSRKAILRSVALISAVSLRTLSHPVST